VVATCTLAVRLLTKSGGCKQLKDPFEDSTASGGVLGFLTHTCMIRVYYVIMVRWHRT
jgi:hypothetical protein